AVAGPVVRDPGDGRAAGEIERVGGDRPGARERIFHDPSHRPDSAAAELLNGALVDDSVGGVLHVARQAIAVDDASAARRALGRLVDAGAFGRIVRIAGDLALAERQPIEDEAGPDLRPFQVRDVRPAREPHRSFAAQVPQDGGQIVGDVDQLLDPSGQVLLQQAGDERVDDRLQPTRQARDGELTEQRLVHQPQRLEGLLYGEWERVPDAVIVPRQPDSADVGHRLVRDAGAFAAGVGWLAVR